MAALHGKAEVIIGKQRHGPIGSVDLAFEGEFTRFSNLAKDEQDLLFHPGSDRSARRDHRIEAMMNWKDEMAALHGKAEIGLPPEKWPSLK